MLTNDDHHEADASFDDIVEFERDDYYELCLEKIRNINYLSDQLDIGKINRTLDAIQ